MKSMDLGMTPLLPGDKKKLACERSLMLQAPPPGGGGVLPYITYTGMCRPKGS